MTTPPPRAAAELTAAASDRALDAAGFAHRLAPVSVAGELAEILADLSDKGEVTESLLAEYRREPDLLLSRGGGGAAGADRGRRRRRRT